MKILIIINDHITYRTYIDTKAFSLINKNLVTYAINTTSNENNLKKIKIKNNCIKFDVNKKNDTLIFKISALHFFSNLSKSLSYQYRFKRLLNFQVLYNSNYHIIKRIYLFFTNLLNKTSLWLLIILPIISLKTFRFYFYRCYLKKIKVLFFICVYAIIEIMIRLVTQQLTNFDVKRPCWVAPLLKLLNP
jgi:hypothetical protein